MVLPRPLLTRSDPARCSATLRYDEHTRVPAVPGEPVAASLLAAGIVATSRSVKFRRPRGPYCLTGDCGTCLARIDGVPNLRTCLTPARDGMRVDPQNRMGPGGLDPTAMADRVFGPAMDHHHFLVRPRAVNRAMQTVARELAGLGQLPETIAPAAEAPVEHRPDVLIVGHGSAGRAAAQVLAEAGFDVLVFERKPEPSATRAYRLVSGAGVFASYRDPTCYAAHEHVATHAAGRLHVIVPRHTLFTTGARDPMLPLANNDLPGVVAGRGLVDLLARASMRPLEPIVLIGRGPAANLCSRALDVPAIAPERVASFGGRGRVEVVRLTGEDGIRHTGEKHEAGLVALAAPPAPAFELAEQAGASTRWDGAGFAVVCDEDGRCATTSAGTVWAAGDVTGYRGPAAAADEGRRVARAIASSLHGTATITRQGSLR